MQGLALQSPDGTSVSSLLGAIPFVWSVGLLFKFITSSPSEEAGTCGESCILDLFSAVFGNGSQI